ncbi:MAG: FtsQ-type POTRA domain-containing protein [Acidimicrobiia bacterium]
MTAIRDQISADRNRPVAPRRRRWIGWLVLVLVLAAATLIAHSPWLSIGEVEVLGQVRSETRARIAGAGVGEGALLVWIDSGAIERAVLADPWVSDVRVDKVFPNRLVVEVLEHRPVAWIEGVLGWMLVAEDGTVVARAPDPEAGRLRASVAFPDVDPGVRPVDPAWHEIVEMALVLDEFIGGTIVLEMQGAEMWTEALGHPVRLGHPIDLADKARTLLVLLGQELPPGAVIDLTSASRPAIVVADPQG